VVSSASGLSVGMYLLITELNNPNYVSIGGSEGSCTWCDGGLGWNGTRARGQIVKITSISGTSIGISPALYGAYDATLPGWNAAQMYALNAFINPPGQPTHYYQQTANITSAPYNCISGLTPPTFPTNGSTITDGTCSWQDRGLGTTTQPLATPFPSYTSYAGVENLQVYANNTGYGSNFSVNSCAYCWISGVEGNYADGNHVSVNFSYFGQIQNSYFSNAFLHAAGSYDSDIDIANKSTGMLVQNNILERLHVSIMLEWGAVGNVIAYNYMFGNFASGSTTFLMDGINTHGAHPMFNLFEGNSTQSMHLDSIWGSHSHNTAFRNWSKGTTLICQPSVSGRSTVDCSGSNASWAVQANQAIGIDFLGSSYNLVGNVAGSQSMANLWIQNQGWNRMAQVNQVVAVCGSTPCGPGSRSYDNAAYALSLGFGEASDDGSSGDDSIVPYSTLFSHGNYSSVTGTIAWSGSLTQTLPASFYMSSKPTWFGSAPWPAIGPDVTGGLSDAYGKASAIPAEVCYESVMGGTNGANSPLSFNANRCYAQSATLPAPPTSVTAVVH
jgi:hypothetical protein